MQKTIVISAKEDSDDPYEHVTHIAGEENNELWAMWPMQMWPVITHVSNVTHVKEGSDDPGWWTLPDTLSGQFYRPACQQQWLDINQCGSSANNHDDDDFSLGWY